jgi:hypothetical protein
MRPEVRQQLAPFNRALLLDSNLLLLLTVGRHDYRLISGFKRTAAFTLEDFALLMEIVGQFRALVTTPNVLTEVSNLAGQLTGRTRREVFTTLRDQMEVLEERYVASREASISETFVRLGLTDAALALVGGDDVLVLSVDFDLVGSLQHAGVSAVNFNHLRFRG